MFIEEWAIRVPGSVNTLARARTGQQVEVVDFLSPRAREVLLSLGLSRGAVLACRDRAGTGIVVECEGGHSLLVAWPYAHLVRVEIHLEAEPGTEPKAGAAPEPPLEPQPRRLQPGAATPRASRRPRTSSGWSRR